MRSGLEWGYGDGYGECLRLRMPRARVVVGVVVVVVCKSKTKPKGGIYEWVGVHCAGESILMRWVVFLWLETLLDCAVD